MYKFILKHSFSLKTLENLFVNNESIFALIIRAIFETCNTAKNSQ